MSRPLPTASRFYQCPDVARVLIDGSHIIYIYEKRISCIKEGDRPCLKISDFPDHATFKNREEAFLLNFRIYLKIKRCLKIRQARKIHLYFWSSEDD